MPRKTITLYAPEVYPTKRDEVRAYTVAAFRVSQGSDQLALISMPKRILDFLIKKRAIGYWKEKGWLTEEPAGYHLTADGLVLCQSALADELQTHNTSASQVGYWTKQFRQNTALARSEEFNF